MANTRVSNGSEWRKLRARVKASGAPCWICGKPIDYRLRWWVDPSDGKRKLHPLSFELDEIVPHSAGGRMIYSNVRPAHRVCNQRRGAELAKRLQEQAPPVNDASRHW